MLGQLQRFFESLRSSPYAAMLAAQDVAARCKDACGDGGPVQTPQRLSYLPKEVEQPYIAHPIPTGS